MKCSSTFLYDIFFSYLNEVSLDLVYMSLELHGSRYGSHLMCLIMNAPSPKDIGKETWKHSGSSDLKSKTKKSLLVNINLMEGP